MQGTNKKRRDLGHGYALWTYTAPDGTERAAIAGFPRDLMLWDGSFSALRAAVESVAEEREPAPLINKGRIYRVELNARKSGSLGAFACCTFDVIVSRKNDAAGQAVNAASALGYETRGANSVVYVGPALYSQETAQ